MKTPKNYGKAHCSIRPLVVKYYGNHPGQRSFTSGTDEARFIEILKERKIEYVRINRLGHS